MQSDQCQRAHQSRKRSFRWRFASSFQRFPCSLLQCNGVYTPLISTRKHTDKGLRGQSTEPTVFLFPPSSLLLYPVIKQRTELASACNEWRALERLCGPPGSTRPSGGAKQFSGTKLEMSVTAGMPPAEAFLFRWHAPVVWIQWIFSPSPTAAGKSNKK